MSFPSVSPYRPFRLLYISAVIITMLFLMAFLWFALQAGINSVRAAILVSMNQYDTANSTYANFTLADTFISNIWTFFLVIVVFALLYWVYIYSSRKGVPVGYA